MTKGRFALLVVVALVVMALVGVASHFLGSRSEAVERQDQLDPFYTPPTPLPSTVPGTLLRQEPLGETVTGAQSFRILYVSQAADGSATVSSGFVLVPEAPAPAGGRPVVAWAHPTVGLGDACAPSRRASPIASQLTQPWMLQMVSFGWIVTATDYSGLGTPGVSQYLVGQAEANDVVNSVRAARALASPGGASTDWMVYGHSQGGHSALWTGSLATSIAPELHLRAVAAAAPAAELVPLVSEQWNKAVAWVIGPEVVYAWPSVFPGLPAQAVVSSDGLSRTETLAQDCLLDAAAEGLVRQKLGHTYFASDPSADAQWKAALQAQTPPPVLGVPVLVSQGTADPVVIPNTTGLLNDLWCKAGSDLTMPWLGGQGHNHMGEMSGTMVGTWFYRVLAGEKVGSTCSVPSTVPAYPTPVSPEWGTSAT